jgi:peptidoglycan/xylan/chitin deacetylase (PgdA/CDA1 family)
MKHKLFFFFYKILGLLLCLIYWDAYYFWWLMGAFLLIYLSIVGLGSYFINLNWFIKSVNENNEEGISFTFDDGPHPKNTPVILNILKKHNVQATFFVIGKEAEKYPDLIKQIVNEGHIIGNHSYSHSHYIPFFWKNKLIKDYKKTGDLLQNIIGQTPNYIRPPFGATSPKYTKLLNKTNYTSFGWTYRTFDTTSITPELLISNTLNAVTKNNRTILLFHDTKDVTANSLDEILQKLNDNGTKIVNIEKSINQLPYE